jgi:hypothetical protein
VSDDVSDEDLGDDFDVVGSSGDDAR